MHTHITFLYSLKDAVAFLKICLKIGTQENKEFLYMVVFGWTGKKKQLLDVHPD